MTDIFTGEMNKKGTNRLIWPVVAVAQTEDVVS